MGTGITGLFPLLSNSDTDGKGNKRVISLPITVRIGQKWEEPGFPRLWEMGIFTSESHLILRHKIILKDFHKVFLVLVENYLKSALVCLGCGLAGVILFFTLQLKLAEISIRIEAKYSANHIYKIIYEDIVYFFIIPAHMLLWRGGWNLCSGYFFKDPRIGGPVSHCIGKKGFYVQYKTFRPAALS